MSDLAVSVLANANLTQLIAKDLKIDEKDNLAEQYNINTSINAGDRSLNKSRVDINEFNTEFNKRKNHNCPYCDRSFTRPYRLNDHISFTHTDEVRMIGN